MKTLIITSNTLVHTDHGFTERDLQFHADKVTEALPQAKREMYHLQLKLNPNGVLSSYPNPIIHCHNTNHTLVVGNYLKGLILVGTIIIS